MAAPLNLNRTRWYGLRVGDTVSQEAFGHILEGVVVILDALDNNCAYIEVEGHTEPVSVVCEWCEIIRRVEDTE